MNSVNILVFGQPNNVTVGDGTLARARRADEHHRQLVRDKSLEEVCLDGRVPCGDDHVTGL